MSLARVHNFSISLDGFGTGEGQSHETPFGHAGQRLHEWMIATRFWGEIVGQPGGSSGVDDAFAQRHGPGIGAEIMGANKFGPPGWHEDPEWKGWWGPNPPFHTPTFVLTHHARPSIDSAGESSRQATFVISSRAPNSHGGSRSAPPRDRARARCGAALRR